MEIADIPEWVPEPVRRAASVYGAGHPMMERFLSEPPMERVWVFLCKQPIEDDFRSRYEGGTGLHSPDFRNIGLCSREALDTDQVLFLLFYAVLLAINNTRDTPNKTFIDDEIEKLRQTQKLVEGLRTWAPWPMLKVEAPVDRAILDIVALCDERIAMLEYRNKPGVVEVKGPESAIESAVRSIGAATHALYGQCCYGQLATMVNVMFAPTKQITPGKVEKWCTRPPLPLMRSKIGRGPKKPH